MLRTEIGPGPTERELDAVEKRLGFTFSTDHRVFLGAGLPRGSSRWPDWRDGAAQDLEGRLAWPVEGVLFDVEHNGFRHRVWPSRPAEKSEALRVARTELESVPQLVPVYGHRYPPGTAGEHGHPTDTTGLPREAARWELVRWWLRLLVNGSLAPGAGGDLITYEGWAALARLRSLRPLVDRTDAHNDPPTNRRADREPLADAIVEEARRMLTGPWPPRG
ncbi:MULTISPECIES: hypothetical protein [Streptomyces]|uniref:Knr4/Smi1-like domain-containing protein n=1 Tax=Streptomyces viridochromogenes TaxID=1938 RepID=A0A0L8KCE2_STRVR|nr:MULTISPECIES: hypothetical protein [Streptomyces]KOG23541.1 hypothetical protein ADK34_19950 [Streptomyces viridochromogenes]